MKSESLYLLSAWALAALAIPLTAAAQDAPQRALPTTQYTVTDLGTLSGGNFSQPFFITKDGHVAGSSNLADGSSHAVVWSSQQAADLGTLGGSNSIAFGTNDSGQAVGEAETSASDPNGEDFCGFGTHLICLPFESANGVMNPLPTLGGNNGVATAISHRGEVAGYAETAIPDPSCPAPQVLHFKPVIWTNGRVSQLRTVGGDPDGVAFMINDNGQAVGASGACAAFNPINLYNLVPVHALLWENGKAINLGNLGGTTGQAGGNIAFDINNLGQVVGSSDLKGDETFHAFLWTKKTRMQDLRTLTGDANSLSISINDAGSIVGASVDASGNPRAFLWEKGVMTDLNTLVAGNSPLYLLTGCSINSRGEITGLGVTSAGEIHTYLATPTQGVASTSQGAISRRTLSDDSRRQLQQQLRLARSGFTQLR